MDWIKWVSFWSLWIKLWLTFLITFPPLQKQVVEVLLNLFSKDPTFNYFMPTMTPGLFGFLLTVIFFGQSVNKIN